MDTKLMSNEGLKMDYVRETCKIGQGNDCCRYLTCGAGGFTCEKLSSLKGLLDSRVKANTITAQGDNCEGVV